MNEYRIKAAVGYFCLALLFLLILFEDDTVGRIFLYLSSLLLIYLLVFHSQFRRNLLHPAVLSGLVLIVYGGLSALWGVNHDILNCFLRALALVFFWGAVIAACNTPDWQLYRFANGMLLVVVVGSLYAVIRYFMLGDLGTRNEGPNILHEPILGPSILIACGSAGIMLRQHLRRSHIRISLGLLVILAFYVLTTRSRGPMLALAAWAVVLLLCERHAWRRNLWVLLGLGMAGVALCLLEPQYIAHLISRGFSGRLVIWENTLHVLSEHLWFGYGMNYEFVHSPVQKVIALKLGYTVPHPHNLALSTTLYSGLVGLLLLAVTTISALAGILRADRFGVSYALPVVFTLLALTLTDVDKLISSPSPIWFIYWLPSACLAGLALRVTQPSLFISDNASQTQ